MIDLLSIWLIVWLLKTATEDVSYAVKGRPNPRYEVKRQKAIAAGKAAPTQPRYGSKDWLGDLVSDGLVAQTERRRAKAAKKAKEAEKQAERDERPLDDLAAAVREEPQRPAPAQVDTEDFPEFRGDGQAEPEREPVRYTPVRVPWMPSPPWTPEKEEETTDRVDVDPGRGSVPPNGAERKGQPRPGAHVKADRALRRADKETARQAGWGSRPHEPTSLTDNPDEAAWQRFHLTEELYGHGPECDRCKQHIQEVNGRLVCWCTDAADRQKAQLTQTNEPVEDTRPDATIIQFPNPRKIEKEISMATSEVTGLSTAIAFAEHAAAAHSSFATAGTEGYTGALVQHGVGDSCVGLAREAQEASNTAAAKWQAHADALKDQIRGREFYQSNPDAGDKQFLLAE